MSEVLEFDFAGQHFRLDSAGGADLVARRMQEGGYEAPLPMLVMAIVARTTGLMLDVGANNGLYSILAAKARPDVRCVAFEPFPAALDVLRRNITLNGLVERVTIHDVALSDSAGVTTMYIPDQGHGLLETSATLEPEFQPFAEKREVRRVRMDDIALPGSVSLIKVDVEGHETAFLRGATALLDRDRPIIFAEMMSTAAHNFEACTQLVASRGYLLLRLRAEHVLLDRKLFYDHAAWNWGLIPYEKLPLFLECCRTHGLEVYQPM